MYIPDSSIIDNDKIKLCDELNKILQEQRVVDMASGYFNIGGFNSIYKLTEVKGESVKYIGKIFKEMLDNSTLDYKQEDIYSIVEYLYGSKYKECEEETDEIGSIYGSRGYEFLRLLWEKHNKK